MLLLEDLQLLLPVKMRLALRCVLCLLMLYLGSSLAIAEPKYVDDPDKYAAEVMRHLVKGDLTGGEDDEH